LVSSPKAFAEPEIKMGIGKRKAVQRVFGVGAGGANISALKSCIDIAASGTQVARKTAEMKKPNREVGLSHCVVPDT
jgi:hypothetical protein